MANNDDLDYKIVELVMSTPALYNFKINAALRTKEKKTQLWQNILLELNITGNFHLYMLSIYNTLISN